MEQGVEAEGKVEDKRNEKISSGQPNQGDQNVYWLHYTFRTKNGHKVNGRRAVRRAVFDSYQKGQTVRVKVDANNSKLHMPEFADVDREFHLGFTALLACISSGVTLFLWVLALLYLTGRINSQSIANLASADLLGRRKPSELRTDASASAISKELADEVESMEKAGKRIEAVRLLLKKASMNLNEARDYLDDLAERHS
jgi:hypothetical protein